MRRLTCKRATRDPAPRQSRLSLASSLRAATKGAAEEALGHDKLCALEKEVLNIIIASRNPSRRRPERLDRLSERARRFRLEASVTDRLFLADIIGSSLTRPTASSGSRPVRRNVRSGDQ